MKILAYNPAPTGVTYYRITTPHETMDELDLSYIPWLDTEKEIDGIDHDIFIFNRYLSEKGLDEHIINEVKKTGTKVVCDVDDYWILPSTHSRFNVFNEKYQPAVIKCIKLSDAVIVTNEELRQKVLPYNENVYIVPNAYNPTHPQRS